MKAAPSQQMPSGGSDHRLVGRCPSAVMAKAASSVMSWTPEHLRETVSRATPSCRATSVMEPMESTMLLYCFALISSFGCRLSERPCPHVSRGIVRCKTHRRNTPRRSESCQYRQGSRHGGRTRLLYWRGAKHRTLHGRPLAGWRNRIFSLSCGVVELPQRDSRSRARQEKSVIIYHGPFCPANVRVEATPLARATDETEVKP